MVENAEGGGGAGGGEEEEANLNLEVIQPTEQWQTLKPGNIQESELTLLQSNTNIC